MTNEQAVVEAGREIARLKTEYIKNITPLVIAYNEENTEPSLGQLLTCQRLANEYFNYVEKFVGDSGLLNAHNSGKWVTGFAEDCGEILLSYILHINFIRSWQSKLGDNINPSGNAYSNMQRMVVEYLSQEQSKNIENKFISHSLPIQGFKMRAVPDKQQAPRWQLITSVSIGVASLVTSIILAILIPEPTTFQEFILRGLFAIALASIASIIPGFVNLKTGVRGTALYLGIYAGGAIAIFILIWMFNPPKINSEQSPDTHKTYVSKSQLTKN